MNFRPGFSWSNIIYDEVLNPAELVGPVRSDDCAPAQRPKNGYFAKLLTVNTFHAGLDPVDPEPKLGAYIL